MQETDVALMELIKRGDDKAFELLLFRHQHSVYNLVVSHSERPAYETKYSV